MFGVSAQPHPGEVDVLGSGVQFRRQFCRGEFVALVPGGAMARWEVGAPGATAEAFTEQDTVLFKNGSAVGDGGFLENHSAVAIGKEGVVRKAEGSELDLVLIVEEDKRLGGLARSFHLDRKSTRLNSSHIPLSR